MLPLVAMERMMVVVVLWPPKGVKCAPPQHIKTKAELHSDKGPFQLLSAHYDQIVIVSICDSGELKQN